MGENNTVRIRIVDDNPIHIAAFAALFSPLERVDFVRCETLEALRLHAENIDLIMINMEYKKRCPCLLLAEVLNEISAVPILCYSADGRIQKWVFDQHADRLIVFSFHKIMRLLNDSTTISKDEIRGWTLEEKRSMDDAERELLEKIVRLSPREMEMLCLVGKGYGAQEVADHLDRRPSTVETHLKNMRGKLQIGTLVELRCLANAYARTKACRAFSATAGMICSCRKASLGSCPLGK